MLKKVLSIALIITVLMSLNVFALCTNDVVYNDVKVIGANAGVDVVLTKTNTTLTANAYLVGELRNIHAVNIGLKILDKTKVSFNDASISEEFNNILPTGWKITDETNVSETKGYVGYECSRGGEGYEFMNVPAGTKVKVAEFNFKIAEDVVVNSTNYSDYLEFMNHFNLYTRLTIDNTLDIKINTATDRLSLLDSATLSALPSVFSFNASGLDSYNLSIADPVTNGIATLSAYTVAGGQATTLTVTPAMGYYISEVKAGETSILSSVIDVYRGGEIEYTPTADTAFAVTFAKIESVSSEAESAGMTGVDAYTLPEVFRGKATEGAAEDVSVAFGQVTPATGKTVAGYGIYLTYTDGREVTTMKPGVGPKFAANSKSADNQFGIIFEQIKPGSYNAQTYIEYTNGDLVLGIKVPFTVAE